MSTTNQIHPLAIVEEGAIIGRGVTVEAFAVIKSTVTLEDHVVIKSHAYIDGFTTIGEGTVIYPSACIGTKTQDKKFRGEKTYVKIGKNCEIREFVTINSSCQEGSIVSIGNNCLIMAYCHVAHNCEVGNGVIMGNGATLAGHIIVDDNAIISGMTGVHQFVRIGAHAMLGGLSRVTHDVPPYTIGAGIPFKFGGLNMIGLKRHGFSLKTRQELSKAYKLMYRSQLPFEEALRRTEEICEPLPEVLTWLNFCRNTKRGLMGLQGITAFEEQEEEQLEETAQTPA